MARKGKGKGKAPVKSPAKSPVKSPVKSVKSPKKISIKVPPEEPVIIPSVFIAEELIEEFEEYGRTPNVSLVEDNTEAFEEFGRSPNMSLVEDYNESREQSKLIPTVSLVEGSVVEIPFLGDDITMASVGSVASLTSNDHRKVSSVEKFSFEQEIITATSDSEVIRSCINLDEFIIEGQGKSCRLSMIEEESESCYSLLRTPKSGKSESDTFLKTNDTFQTEAFVFLDKDSCRCRPCHPRRKSYTPKSLTTKRLTVDTISDEPYDEDEVTFDSASGFDQESFDDLMAYSGMEHFMITLRFVLPTTKMLDIQKTVNSKFENFGFKWNFLKYPDKVLFNVLDKEKKRFVINYQRVYSFNISKVIYTYLYKCAIPLELYIKYENDNYRMIGRAELSVKDGLSTLDKVHDAILEIDNNMLRQCGSHVPLTSFGEVYCQFAFGGSLREYEECKYHEPQISEIPVMGSGSYESLLSQTKLTRHRSSTIPGINQLELKAFQTGLDLVLIRNTALKSTQEQVNTELNNVVDWMHHEMQWKITLEETAILRGDDPSYVRWRQWKDESISNVNFRSFGNEEFKINNRAEFTITICELEINPMSRIFRDDNIIKMYVEYSFLNYTGISLETPSQIKPDTEAAIVYDYKTTFTIEKDDEAAILLGDMMRYNESITFTVVSEPLEDKSVIQVCTDIGSCEVNMFDLVQHCSDGMDQFFSIMDHSDEGSEVGKLKLSFDGILSLRSMSLLILTPESYNILR